MTEPNEPVEFVAFNMAQQIALDDKDRVWTVDMWIDGEGDEIMDRFYDRDAPPHTLGNVNMEQWEHVVMVTVTTIIDGRRVYSTLAPDDFDASKNN